MCLTRNTTTIKVTAEWPKAQINFLDVTVYLENEKIETDLYVQPTDTHQYLHSSSCHSYHCKKGTPYSQTLRLIEFAQILDFLIGDVMTWKDGY